MTEQQNNIYSILKKMGPLSQHGVIHAMKAVQQYTSPSGIRSRMSELERIGWIKKTDDYERTPAGRRAYLYKAVV